MQVRILYLLRGDDSVYSTNLTVLLCSVARNARQSLELMRQEAQRE